MENQPILGLLHSPESREILNQNPKLIALRVRMLIAGKADNPLEVYNPNTPIGEKVTDEMLQLKPEEEKANAAVLDAAFSNGRRDFFKEKTTDQAKDIWIRHAVKSITDSKGFWAKPEGVRWIGVLKNLGVDETITAKFSGDFQAADAEKLLNILRSTYTKQNGDTDSLAFRNAIFSKYLSYADIESNLDVITWVASALASEEKRDETKEDMGVVVMRSYILSEAEKRDANKRQALINTANQLTASGKLRVNDPTPEDTAGMDYITGYATRRTQTVVPQATLTPTTGVPPLAAPPQSSDRIVPPATNGNGITPDATVNVPPLQAGTVPEATPAIHQPEPPKTPEIKPPEELVKLIDLIPALKKARVDFPKAAEFKKQEITKKVRELTFLILGEIIKDRDSLLPNPPNEVWKNVNIISFPLMENKIIRKGPLGKLMETLVEYAATYDAGDPDKSKDAEKKVKDQLTALSTNEFWQGLYLDHRLEAQQSNQLLKLYRDRWTDKERPIPPLRTIKRKTPVIV